MVVAVGSGGAGCATAEASHPFVAVTEELGGGTAVVAVSGEVDFATTPALEQALLGVADERTLKLIVDLTDCSFLDCSGLGVLIAARTRFERSRRPLVLIAPGPSVLRIFEVTELDKVFDIYPSRRAAVAANGNGHR